MARLSLWATVAAASTAYATSGTIQDIEHVVLFMQENRAFDHYFGTMAGVRGFKDPNVQVNNGTPVWYQQVDSTLNTTAKTLLPWYLNYLGGEWNEATQCMYFGDNGYEANHGALNHDLNDQWPIKNTPSSWGHFTRKELPAHFAIAEGWTVGDMYQESVIASTNPNRVAWASGSINSPGGPQTPDQGGMTIDNNETPGCEGTNLNCYPLKWTTAVEHYQNANVTWQVYQDTDNFDDNPWAWFEQFQTAPEGSELQKRGVSFIGLERFYEDAAKGTLPQVSLIVGPMELSEHPPNTPHDGAWLQAKVVEAVTSSPKYKSTALIISYDETGGQGDHVVPYHSPPGTTGEWIEDPYGTFGQVYVGPGFRLPFYIVSPWTRGGNVYTEHADHSSQLKFVEEWLASKGHNARTPEIPAWRRTNMADLTRAFDFAHPDFSLPTVPNVTYPSTDSKGNWNGYAACEAAHKTTTPPPPYNQQNEQTALQTEQGFKAVRGQLTEGRYLVFEMNGYALQGANGKFAASKASAAHSGAAQRFVLHQVAPGSVQFEIRGGTGGSIGQFTITDLGGGKGHSLKNSSGKFVQIDQQGAVQAGSSPVGFKVFSVTYDD